MSAKRRCISTLTTGNSIVQHNPRYIAQAPQCLGYSTTRCLNLHINNGTLTHQQPRHPRHGFQIQRSRQNVVRSAQFSTSTPLYKLVNARMPNTQRKSQPSMAIARAQAQKEIMSNGTLLKMAGVVNGTFVMPTGRNLPSWTKDGKQRLTMEWRRAKQYLLDMGRNWWVARSAIDPALKLDKRRDIVARTKEAYVQVYTAFGKGDIAEIENEALPGFVDGLKKRIAQRQRDTYLRWKLEELLEPPSLSSYKVGLQPAPRGEPKSEAQAVIQAVVKIRSLQSLQTVRRVRARDGKNARMVEKDIPLSRDGVEITEEEAADRQNKSIKETTEYVVMQKFQVKGKLEDWKIWGMAEETTEEKWKQMEATAAQMARMHMDQMQKSEKPAASA